MRIVIDSLIVVMLLGAGVGVLLLRNNKDQGEQDIVKVQQALQRLHDKAEYYKTVQSAMAQQDTLLVHLDQAWFGENVPANSLISDGHPWIDLAPPGDLGTHPPDPIASDKGQAGFWYNPTLGIFRARVAQQATDADTLTLYNQVNGTQLAQFELLPDPAREPLAHTPGKTPAKQYASMANRTWAKPEAKTDELLNHAAAAPASVEPTSDAPSADTTDHAIAEQAVDPAPSADAELIELIDVQALPDELPVPADADADADADAEPESEQTTEAPRPTLQK